MALESALVKPVVDAIMALLRRGENMQLNRNAEKAVREAFRELLLASPDENKAAARIAVAKAAGLLSEDVVLAEEMLQKHRATKARTRGKAGSGRKRVAAKTTSIATKNRATKSKASTSTKSVATSARTPSRTGAKPVAKKNPAPRKKPASKPSSTRRRSDDTD